MTQRFPCPKMYNSATALNVTYETKLLCIICVSASSQQMTQKALKPFRPFSAKIGHCLPFIHYLINNKGNTTFPLQRGFTCPPGACGSPKSSSIGNIRMPVCARYRPRSIACCLYKSWVSWSAPSCWCRILGCWCAWGCLRSLRLPSSMPQQHACTIRCSSRSFSLHRSPHCEVLPSLRCVSHAFHPPDNTSSVSVQRTP